MTRDTTESAQLSIEDVKIAQICPDKFTIMDVSQKALFETSEFNTVNNKGIVNFYSTINGYIV